jgi:hypothetical protein
MMLAAIAAAMVFPVGFAHGGAVTDGALMYQRDDRGRSVIRRLDLDSGLQETVYTAPDRRTAVMRMRAGGGRVVFETVAKGVRIIAMDPHGGNREEIARGRDDGRGVCGTAVRLLDVSTSGEVLYERARVGCRTHRGRYALRSHSPDGSVRTLLSRPTRTVYLGLEPPYRQLAGNQLVTWGNRLVRVRDLATGRARRFVPPDRLTTYGEPAVAADARVLLSEFRFMGRGRLPRQTIRLVRPGRTPEVVHRRQGVYGEGHFCGERPVLHTFNQRGRLRLSLLDPPLPVFEGVMDPEAEASCDARHFVLLTIATGDGDSERAFVQALPQ